MFYLQGKADESAQGFSLEADDYEYNDKNQTITATNDATLKGNGIFLNANRILWDKKSNLVRAYGKIILSSAGYRLLADNLIFDLETGVFTADNVKTGLYPWTVSADQIMASDSNYTLRNATVSNEQQEKFSPRVEFQTAVYDLNSSQLTARDLGLLINGKLVGRIPKLSHNLGRFDSSYELIGGEQNSLGWYGGARITHASNPEYEIETKLAIYEKRGLFLRPSFTYTKDWDSEFRLLRFKGSFGGIKDRGDRGTDFRNKIIKQDRGYAHVGFFYNEGKNWRFNINLEPQSDADFIRDFERDKFANSQWVENFAEIVYNGKWLSSSISTDWQINNFAGQIEKKPKISLLLGPNSWFNKHFQETVQFDYSQRNARDEFGEAIEKLSSRDFSAISQAKFHLGNGIKYSPAFTFKRIDYSLKNKKNASKSFGEIINDLSLSVKGLSRMNAPLSDNLLSHFSTFRFKHSYNKKLGSKNLTQIPILEENLVHPSFGNSDLFDFSDYDDLGSYHRVKFVWENQLVGISRAGMIKDFITLDLEQDIWVDQKSDFWGEPYFYGFLSINLLDSIVFSLKEKIDTSNGQLAGESVSLSLRDGAVNKYSVSRISDLRVGESVLLSGVNEISENIICDLIVRYDPKLKNWEYWYAGVSLKKPSGWEWSVFLSEYSGTKKEDDISVGLSVNLFSF